MTLRKQLAAAMREGADQASSRAIDAFLSATESERAAHATRRFIAAAAFCGYVRRIADLLDPNGDASVVGDVHQSQQRSAAPAASGRVGGVEQAARSAAAEVKGGQGEQSSTERRIYPGGYFSKGGRA